VGIEALHGQFSTDMWDPDEQPEPEVEEQQPEEAVEPSLLQQVLSSPEIARMLGGYRTIK
jgi:hypothetical protein